jgi:hypothetical protein
MSPRTAEILGPLFKLARIKQGLWYSHSNPSKELRFAARIVDKVFSSSVNSLPIRSTKARFVGHGINVSKFINIEESDRKKAVLSLGRIAKIKNNEEQKEFKTIYSCNNGNCIPYREWAHQLKSESGLQQLKTALETIKKTQKFRLCEFDLESNKCVRDDVKTSLLSPLTPISRHFIEGMKLSNVKTTKSGGLSFDGSMMQGERFLGITKGYATCAEQSGKLEFLNDIVELNIGRSYCLGVVPFPGTTKLNINVLIADPSNKQFIVKWDWGLVAFMAVGSGDGIARLTIE